MPFYTEIMGIPVADKAKYLGLMIDDKASFAAQNDLLRSNLKAFKWKLTMAWAHRAPLNIKLIAFHSQIYSRFTYGLAVMAHFDKKVEVTMRQIIYRCAKGLMGIKSNTNANETIRAILGVPIDEYVAILKRCAMNLVTPHSDREAPILRGAINVNLRQAVLNDLGPIVKLICGQLLRPHKHKHLLKCRCGETINDTHARRCEDYQLDIS